MNDKTIVTITLTVCVFLALLISAVPCRAQASGVIIDNKGHVLTAAHVVTAYPHPYVYLENRVYKGRVVAKDVRSDLALIAIPLDTKISASLGDDKGIGAFVYKLGFGVKTPFYKEGRILTFYSSINHRDSTPDTYGLTSTTPIVSPGDSGGGLFDYTGGLIGVTSSYSDDPQHLCSQFSEFKNVKEFLIKNKINYKINSFTSISSNRDATVLIDQ